MAGRRGAARKAMGHLHAACAEVVPQQTLYRARYLCSGRLQGRGYTATRGAGQPAAVFSLPPCVPHLTAAGLGQSRLQDRLQ